MDIRNYFSKNLSDAGGEKGLSSLRKGPQTPENKLKTISKTKLSPEKKIIDTTRKSVRNIISDEDSDPEDPIPSKLSKKIGKPLPKQQKTTRNNKSKAIVESESDEEKKSTKKFTNIRKSPRNKSHKKFDADADAGAAISEYMTSGDDDDEVPKIARKTSGCSEKLAKKPSETTKKRSKRLDSDDDEDFESPTLKKTKTSRISSPLNKKCTKKDSPVKKNVPKLNPISVSDFFGGAKVKTKNQEKIVEIELHSDDDFNETLKNAENDLLTPMSGTTSVISTTKTRQKTPSKIETTSKLVPKSTEKSAYATRGNNTANKKGEKIVVNEPKVITRAISSPDKSPDFVKVKPRKEDELLHNGSEFDSNSNSLLKKSPVMPRRMVEITPQKEVKGQKITSQTKSIRSKKSPVPDRPAPRTITIDDNCLSWVEKYRPKSIKQIVGQQGDRSCLNKLLNWMKNWKSWHITKTKEKKKGFGANDDGSFFKAALLSGSPGIGKTTTAQLCCKELGLNFIEMNASDARNKKTLEKDVAESLACHSMDEYVKVSSNKYKSDDVRHVLIMDEVDGMSGNEDRAGMAELISLIKSTRVPIICICNDRQAQKIRSLSNYCYDLRFHKPQVTQIRGPMMSIAFKENMKISGPSMDEIIEGANHDIRQILNHLSVLAAGDDKQISTDDARSAANKARKDTLTNIFETIRVLFSDNEETKAMTLIDKSDLFFTDYSLIPLFVHENYLNVEQKDKKKMYERLDLISKAADSLAIGDIVEKQIRTGGNWTLLNDLAMFSAVIPADYVRGYLKGMSQFPQWFGKNSKQGRLQRLLQQLQVHTSLKLSANFTSLNLDYLPAFRSGLTVPLTTGDTDGVLQKLAAYDLTKDDMDNILELSQFPNAPDPMSSVPSKVKAALTRTYNKEHTKLPYAVADQGTGGKRSKGVAKGGGPAELEIDEEGNLKEKRIALDDDDEEANGDEPDDQPALQPKVKSNPPNKTASKTVSTGRGGRGRGKNRN